MDEGRIEIQGIVSARTGEPLVQMRGAADAQLGVMEAREIAQNLVEAAQNAVSDAALITWAREAGIEDEQAFVMVDAVRRHRADRWGLPDRPEDWRNG